MNLDILKELCYAQGVSGREEKITEKIKSLICCDECFEDSAGNLICGKKSDKENAPKIILDAHKDTIGLCVKEIEERGFLKVSAVGGIDERILPGSLVTVHGKKDVTGIVATKPPHLKTKEDEEKQVKIEDIFVDTAGGNCGISIGDRISYKSQFDRLLDMVSATYLDNRISCALIIELFLKLKDTALPFDIIAVFSTGEELGLKGAKSCDIEADMALILDVTFAKTYDEKSDEALLCGGGVAIGVGPNNHKKISGGLEKCAKENGIKYQTEILEGCSGTNAWTYQVKGFGIPCGMLSIPIKYMHTPAETVAISDFDETFKLLYSYITALTAEEICELSEVKIC